MNWRNLPIVLGAILAVLWLVLTITLGWGWWGWWYGR
jgi:hypothetical protein